MTDIEIFEVGGCVRDELMGKSTKDIDFTVVAPSFEDMRAHLIDNGFTIHVEAPQFQTIRCGVPADHPLRRRTKDADFVWARIDGPSSDGRRPDWVEPGTLADDLARRDFTVNAMARTIEGNLIDPHGGEDDLASHTLRFVGDPFQRIKEDGLRIMRGLRFMVTKGLMPTHETWRAMNSHEGAEALELISLERIKDELDRMFAHDTIMALHLLNSTDIRIRVAMFRGSLHMQASLKEV